MTRASFLLFLCLAVTCFGRPVATDSASLIKPLIDPVKLATLSERGANTRVQKITAILYQAQEKGEVEVGSNSRSTALTA